MSLVKNQDIQLNIEGYTAEGNGVGHYEGQAVFVSGAAKGDTIIAHIIKAKKTYAIGIIKQILKKSNDRIDVDCPHFVLVVGVHIVIFLMMPKSNSKDKRLLTHLLVLLI